MPGGNKNIRPEDNTNGFQKNPQNINKKGRPKKLIGCVNDSLKKEGFIPASKKDISEAYLLLLNMPLDRIKEIADNREKTNYPYLYKYVAKEMLRDKGGNFFEKMQDRALGKPEQKISQFNDEPPRIKKVNIHVINHEQGD
jgi:hypothetical protein